MGRLALSLSLALLLLAVLCRGDGFNLEDAIDGGDDSKKTTAPPPQPKPGSHGNSGGFEDSDLLDGNLPPENPQSGGDDSGSAGAKTVQRTNFSDAEDILSQVLQKLDDFFKKCCLQSSLTKTKVATFHVSNRYANYYPSVKFQNCILQCNNYPKYLA
ncbi:CD99 antigen-like isoform X2 [Crotalus tigris]|uniref:CD99 antigen-like isoform X2 n=1 Tax=Crotalus tigris TaxID=88082 RepID=UPI00192F6722|nr:CD99 antigen-like isoform X2 [Crotalus tigris]